LLEIRLSRGFTLLELLVVFVIISILTVLALPSLLNFNQEQNTTMTAQKLYYALQYARSEAVKRNQFVYVNFQTGNNWCYGINANANCNCSVTNSCNLTNVSAPTSQSTVMSGSGLSASNSVNFEPTHGASGTKSIVTFTTSTGGISAMSVEVPIMGSVVLCSTTISGYSACP
jgi:prepilin-type N-terminal cleavage/methylation domain-containing protein